jgi:hypothetical protein
MRFNPICGALAMILAVCGGLGAQSKPKNDRLIVYGKDFSFGVKEPDSWRGDTGEIANKYQVNVIFLPSQEESLKRDVTIRVRVSKKVDENTIEDLNYDMQQYKKKYPTAQFKELNVVHPEYRTFARNVFVPDQFYEYVAYLNPGPGKPLIFAVAMSKMNAPATDAELTAYKSVLESMRWLTSQVTTKP